VDLAAEPGKTAVARIRWSEGRASVLDIRIPAEDDQIIEAIAQADKAGIDCPFGWPAPFIDFLAAHRSGRVVAPAGVAGRDWRRKLAYRSTDREVSRVIGRWPLSVSADRIGHTTMRCASLLARLAERGEPVDRAGGGAVVEVYPAASLRLWGLTARSYKGPGNRRALGKLVEDLSRMAPWLELGACEEVCRRSDDAADAVVAALTARAAQQGLTTAPDAEQAEVAATEGWIMLPEKGSLGRLAE
jgi:predicted nuclease with RNAse H fold